MVCHSSVRVVVAAMLFVLAGPVALHAEDSIEFLNGSKTTGTVKQIRKADKEFDFEVKIGKRTFKRTYSFAKIHAVTMNGKRYELNPKPVPKATGGESSRKKSDVKAIIEAAGSTPPDWFDATPLEYPKTLDLSWPLKPATKGWRPDKNMVHYLYTTIQENPRRFHSGIKLVHHCMALHKSDKTLLQRDMKRLGGLYFELVKDYARAAFWYQKVNPPVSETGGIYLAACYWRLGSRDMALDMLRGKTLSLGAIKLLGEMGEIDAAIQVTRAYSKSNASNQAFLLCGDALRQAGRTDEAIRYYQRVVNSTRFRNKEYENRFKGRARDSIEAIRVFDRLDVSSIADGTYRANAIGYAGRLDVDVRVRTGRIDSVKVTSHREKRHYKAVTDIPDSIIAKQTVKGIDVTSGATVTSQAIVNATAKALARGAK